VHSQTPELFLSHLQELDPDSNSWFNAKRPHALAGRCLLDTLEYLRANPKYPGRFQHVTNAHTVRLICQYLCNEDLQGKDVLARLQGHIKETCRQLRKNQNAYVPHYGDDFWDWASVLEAFVTVKQYLPSVLNEKEVNRELRDFYNSVEEYLSKGTGLTKGAEGEWYGPATATIAYRLLSNVSIPGKTGTDKVCDELRKQALDLITDDYKYRGHNVPRHLVLWHYGQVVATFGKEAQTQSLKVADLSSLGEEKPERAYALARVLQGAYQIQNETLRNNAIDRLYECESPTRPLGQGLIADHPKGSLNVLEGLWPWLDSEDRKQLRSMIDALLQCYTIANTVGIVIAIENEAEALGKIFVELGATKKQKENATALEHPDYYVVVRQGKSLAGSLIATRDLIEKDKAKCVIMVGIAGSLTRRIPDNAGKAKSKRLRKYFRGPRKFDVVVAAAAAPYLIRDKVRDTPTARSVVVNAGVPLDGSVWMVVPTDPGLFRLAHQAGDELFGEKEQRRLHEGLIITGRGIKDALKEKREILRHFPGGLAVEEEGYVMALLCMTKEIPFLNIRGISDFAVGKWRQKQNPRIEKKEQTRAAVGAAQVAARVVKQLSRQWWSVPTR
jgi:nucleoside phosphorylase